MSSPASTEIWIVGAKRTAFGAFGGAFKSMTATTLAVHAAKAAISQAGVRPQAIDQIVIGNVQQTAADAIYIARHVGLLSGVPHQAPALTVNRLCGSGFQAVIHAAEQIMLGHAQICLAGGTENMSQAPHLVYGARWGFAFGKSPEFQDSLWSALTDSYAKAPMGITAENLAKQYSISRAQADEYAVMSQQRWADAQEKGYFAEEIAPVTVKTRKGEQAISVDEHPRPQTTLDALAKLKPVFSKEGVVTAGNASGISDGASVLVVTSRAAAQQHGLKPLARLVGWGIAGVDPQIMGIGPAPAIRQALQRSGHEMDAVDLFEVNEAFAPQYLSVEKELGLSREKTNVNGGAISLGHPLGASGARITTHLCYEMKRRNAKRSIGSACIGGGQGIAVLLESPGA